MGALRQPSRCLGQRRAGSGQRRCRDAETARTLAELTRQGWKPKRTILLALWDGEEWGLIGSTEWMEKHQDEIDLKMAAYLNSDTNDTGWIGVGGSHTLQAFIMEVLRDVSDPVDGQSLLDATRAHHGNPADPHVPAIRSRRWVPVRTIPLSSTMPASLP